MTIQTATPRLSGAETTVLPILLAITMGHLLNDVMQSVIAASYPLLKTNLALSFTQIGLVTFVFQGTGSLLQPLVGFYTDKRPLPYAMAAGMASTGAGLILLSQAQSLTMVLLSVGCIGLGSAIFHPEASRIARLAAGMRPGFAQSLFQVGGNTGSALGPLAAAWIVLPHGQTSIAWFAGAALLAICVLASVGRWYQISGAGRAKARKARFSNGSALPKTQVRKAFTILVLLMLAKNIYMASFSSYYTFYLIERFELTTQQAQICLFIFLASVAAGTFFGGPIGDKIGRRQVIIFSIVGIIPLALLQPWVPLIPTVCLAALTGMILASAFPAMMVYAQDLLPQYTGMVAGIMFGLAFGLGAIGAVGIGILADHWGIIACYQLCAFLPFLGLAGFALPNQRNF